MKYKTVLLDADGTLMDFHRSEDEAVREALKKSGICPDDEQVRTYSGINDSLWKMLERGEIRKEVLMYRRFELFCEYYGYTADAKRIGEDYKLALSTKGYLLPGAEEFCATLSRYCRLYIVTNGVDFIQKGRYARVNLRPYIREVFISGEIGYEKPDVRYFEAVARKIPDFEKESTLIVGDSLTSDMRGGVNFGIDTCWYNPKGKEKPGDMALTFDARSFEEILRFVLEGESEHDRKDPKQTGAVAHTV